MKLDQLVQQIELVHTELQKFAVKQVNNALTIRNITIGYYIVENEQHGADRANYGENTIKILAERLKHIKGISKTLLYRFIDFYKTYPQIFSTVSGLLGNQYTDVQNIFPTVLGKLIPAKNEISFEPEVLLNALSFSHSTKNFKVYFEFRAKINAPFLLNQYKYI